MVMRQQEEACSQRHYRGVTTLFHVSGDTSSSSYILGRAAQLLVRGSLTPRRFSPPGSSSAGPTSSTTPLDVSATTPRLAVPSSRTFSCNDSSMMGCTSFLLGVSSKVYPSAPPLAMSNANVAAPFLASVDLASVNRRRRRRCRNLARSFDRNPGPLETFLVRGSEGGYGARGTPH